MPYPYHSMNKWLECVSFKFTATSRCQSWANFWGNYHPLFRSRQAWNLVFLLIFFTMKQLNVVVISTVLFQWKSFKLRNLNNCGVKNSTIMVNKYTAIVWSYSSIWMQYCHHGVFMLQSRWLHILQSLCLTPYYLSHTSPLDTPLPLLPPFLIPVLEEC